MRGKGALLAWLAGAAGTALFLLGLGTGTATSAYFASGAVVLYNPTAAYFCSRCHPNLVQRWRASTHAETRCIDCHSREGTLGFWSENLYAFHITLTAFNGHWRKRIPLRTQVNDTACLRCHFQPVDGPRTGRRIAGLNDRLVFQGKTFTHGELYSQGYKCTMCHSTVVEGDLVPPGSRTYPHLPPDWPRTHEGEPPARGLPHQRGIVRQSAAGP